MAFSTGFTRELEIHGVGNRAEVKGKIATFTLGYSHPIEVLLPVGVDLKVDPPKSSGQPFRAHAERLRPATTRPGGGRHPGLRKPDPYKNKGIRYTGEVLRKKVVKPARVRNDS